MFKKKIFPQPSSYFLRGRSQTLWTAKTGGGCENVHVCPCIVGGGGLTQISTCGFLGGVKIFCPQSTWFVNDP